VDDIVQALKELSVQDADNILAVKSKKSADDSIFTYAVFGVLFEGENLDLLAEIKAKSAILSKVINNESAQIALLRAIENYCGKVNASQLPKVPLILKELYDNDVLEEENILKWASDTKGSVKTVRDQAAPMITWLKEAEEESEEDEEDEE